MRESNNGTTKTISNVLLLLWWSLKKITEKLAFLRLASLNLLPLGSSVDKVGKSEFGPDMASKLI